MLELTEYEEKLISAVLTQMRIDNEELRFKTDYGIIMTYLAPHVNLTKAMSRTQ